MPTFGPPVYPMNGSVWNAGRTPVMGLPDHVNIPFQLYCSPYMNMDFNVWNYGGAWGTILIKTPEGLVVYGRSAIIMPDNTVAEYYAVQWREHFYKGFASAFLGILVSQCDANGTVPRTY